MLKTIFVSAIILTSNFRITNFESVQFEYDSYCVYGRKRGCR